MSLPLLISVPLKGIKMKGGSAEGRKIAAVCKIFWQYLILFSFWKLRPS
jgi:hypothetical protein